MSQRNADVLLRAARTGEDHSYDNYKKVALFSRTSPFGTYLLPSLSLTACNPRRSIPATHSHRMVGVVGFRPDSVQVALNSYDILLHLFDHLQSSHTGSDRTALSSCASVCRAWQEPASYVLWRNIPALHPLWNLLAGRNFPQEAKWISPFWEVRQCN